MILAVGLLLALGLGLLPIGPALVVGMLAGPSHTDRVVAVPAPPEDCNCGIPANPRGPR